MKIFETLDRDPRSVQTGQQRTGSELMGPTAELRAELETFVCEGQFSDAMQRILESYLTKSQQSAAEFSVGERISLVAVSPIC